MAFALAACNPLGDDDRNGHSDHRDVNASTKERMGPSIDAHTGRPVPTDPVPPQSFTGKDSAFLDKYSRYRAISKETDRSDAAVALGREFCSIISGGGLLRDKVDYWAGFHNFTDGAGALLAAAGETYCPAYWKAYLKDRTAHHRARPSAHERADYARFAYSVLVGPGEHLRGSDRAIARRARAVCSLPDDQFRQRMLDLIGSKDRTALGKLSGYATAYCRNRYPQ